MGRVLLGVLFVSNVVAAHAQAQAPRVPAPIAPIADPRAPLVFRPSVTTLGSGASVVNITAPNAAGMSLNQYQRFDAPAAGVVLNNSQAGGTALLGGGIGANPNLTNATASTIVNEVTVTGSPSFLAGTIEVFGAPAAVIIANPSGITCAGCGVVNTPRLTFVTGTPKLQAADGSATSWANASRLAWDIKGGQIRILDNGIEGTVGRLDLLGQSLFIDGPLRAHYLNQDLSSINLAAGTQGFSLQADGNWGPGPTLVPGAPMPPTQGVAIDATALGAMTAGQIRIVSTDAGMGVNLRGPLNAFQQGIQASSNGALDLGQAAAVQGIQLSANGHLSTGSLAAGATIDANSTGAMTMGASSASSIRAGGDIKLRSGGDLLIANQLGASLATQGNLLATAKGNLILGHPSAQVSVAGSAQLQGAGQNGGVLQQGKLDVGTDLSVNADADTHLAGEVHAGNNVQVQAGGTAMASGLVSAGNDLAISATNVYLPGALQIGRDASVQATKHLSLTGTALVGNDLSLSGATLDISGKIAARNTGITGDSIVLGAGGAPVDISGGLAVNMQRSIDVQSALNISGNASFTSGTDTNLTGPVQASGAFAVNAGGNANVGPGGVQAGSVQMRASNIHVGGDILSATALSLDAANALSVQGGLAAGGDVALGANQVTVAGSIQTLGAANITSRGGDVQIQGDLVANKALTVNSAGAATINGRVASGATTRVTAQGSLKIDGELAAGGATTLQTGGNLSIAGPLRSAGPLQANAAGAIDVQGQSLVLGDASIASGGAQTWGGPLTATGKLDASSTSGNFRVAGAIGANGPVTITSGGGISAAALASGGQAKLDAVNDIAITGASQVQGGSLKSTAGAVRVGGNLDSQQALSLQAQTDVRLGGKTAVGGDLTATGATGSVHFAQDLAVGGNLIGTAGQNLEFNGATSRIVGSATLAAGQAGAGGKTLNQSVMTVGQGLIVNQSGDFINEATVQANGDIAIRARNIHSNLNTTGGIATTGKLDLNASQKIAFGAQGSVTSKGDTTLAAAQGMSNAGRLTSGGKLDYTGATSSASFTNAASGSVAATNVAIHADLANSGSLWGDTGVSARDTTNGATGSIGSHGAVSLGALGNSGAISGNGISAGATSNIGTIVSDGVNGSIGITGGLYNTGTVSASGDLTSAGGDLFNAGQIAGSNLLLGAERLTNSGVIQSAGSTHIYGGALENFGLGQINAATTLKIDMSGAGANRATITSGASTDVKFAGAFANTRNTTNGTGTNGTAGAGVLAAGTTLSVKAASLNNDGGTLQAASTLDIKTGEGNVSNGKSATGAAGNMRASQVDITGKDVSNKGLIQATAGAVTINASGAFSNTGSDAAIDAPSALKITAKSIDNATGAKLQAAQTVDLTATSGGVSNGGMIYGPGGAPARITINAAGGSFANTGTAIAGQNLTINATGYTNSGTVGSLGDASLTAGSYDPTTNNLVALGTFDIAAGNMTIGVGQGWTSAASLTRWNGTLTNYGSVTLLGSGKGDVDNLSSGQVEKMGLLPTDLSYIARDGTPPPGLTGAQVVGYTDVEHRAQLNILGGLDGALRNRASDASVGGASYTPQEVAQSLIWEGKDDKGKTVQVQTAGTAASLARLKVMPGGTIKLTGPDTGTIVGENFTIQGADLTVGSQVDGTTSRQAMNLARERSVNAGTGPATQGAATQAGSGADATLASASNMKLPSEAGLQAANQPGHLNTGAPDLSSAQGAAAWLGNLNAMGGNGGQGGNGAGPALQLFDWNQFGSIPNTINAGSLNLDLSGKFTNLGTFAVRENLVISAAKGIDNSGAHLKAGGQIALFGGGLNNRGGTIDADSLYADLDGDVDNTQGRIVAGKDAAITTSAGILASEGTFESTGGRFTLDAGGNINLEASRVKGAKGAQVLAGGNIELGATQTTNRATLETGTYHTETQLRSTGQTGGGDAQSDVFVAEDVQIKDSSSKTTTDTVRHQGTVLDGGEGELTVIAGGNVKAQGSEMKAQGRTTVMGENVSIEALVDRTTTNTEETNPAYSADPYARTTTVQETLSGGTVQGGQGVTIVARSDKAGQGNVNLTAARVNGGEGGTTVLASGHVDANTIALRQSSETKKDTLLSVTVSNGVGDASDGSSTSQTYKTGTTSEKTETVQQAGSVLDGGKGDLRVVAGGNVTGIGSDFKADGTTSIAGKNVSIEAAKDRTTTAKTENRYNHDEQHNTTKENLAGGYVLGGKGVSIVAQSQDGSQGVADGNVILKGAQVNAGTGNATVIASGNISVLSQNVADDKYDRVYDRDKGTFRTKTSVVEEDTKVSAVAGSQIKGQNVLLQAGKVGADGQLVNGQGDIVIQGSTIKAQETATLNAGRDIHVTTGQATKLEEKNESRSRSGFSGSFFSGISVGKSSASAGREGTTRTEVPSEIGAANVQMQAGRDATIAASNVLADKNVNITAGRNVNLLAARDSDDSQFASHSKSTSSGLMPGLSGSLVLFGTNSANENGTEKAGTGSTSVISATGGNLVLRAGADAQYKNTGQGNVLAQGADLLAKDRVSVSGNAVHLEAVDNTRDSTYHADSKSFVIGSRPAGALGAIVNMASDAYQNSRNGSSDRLVAAGALKAGYDAYKLVDQAQKAAATAGAGAAAGDLAGGIGVSVYWGASKSSQDSDSQSNKQRGTNIQAANIDVSANEGDIAMQGAKLQAENIALDAARDLKLGTAQSSQTLHSTNKSSSVGGGVTMSFGGTQQGLSFQANAAQARGHANGSETNYDNTQILASNNLSVKSGGNTELKGAQLAGKKVTTDIGGNLLIETLQDISKYDSKQTSSGFDISVCVIICYGVPVTGSISASKTTINHNYVSATGQSGIAAGEGGYDIKVAGNTDLKGGAITSTAAKDKNNLQTKSLSFSDLENQQDTNVSASSISLAYGGGSAMATMAANAAGNALGNSAAKAGLPESGSEKSQTQSVISPANVTITGQDKDGTSQQAVASLTSRDAATANGALKNNLTLVQAQDIQKNQKKAQDDIRAAGMIGAIGAEAIGDVAAQKGWVEGSTQKVLLHGLLGAGLAMIGGGSAATGFITGAANELVMGAMGDYLESKGVVRGSEDFKQLMLAGSAVFGTVVGKAAGGNPTDVALSGQTAKTATEHNFLKHDQAASMKKDFDQCKAKAGGCTDDDTRSITQKYLGLSQANIDAVNDCVVAGDVACVTKLQSQAASAGEVDQAIPVGSGGLARDLMGRQSNVNNYGSVKGTSSLFGTDTQQAAEVARFRQENCAGIAPGACNTLVNQAIDDRYGRVGALTIVGAGAAAVGSLAGVRLQMPKGAGTRAGVPAEGKVPAGGNLTVGDADLPNVYSAQQGGKPGGTNGGGAPRAVDLVPPPNTYPVYPRGVGAADGPLPPGYTTVSRWVSPEEASLWVQNQGTAIPSAVPRNGTPQLYVTEAGAPYPPGANGTVRIDFAVPNSMLQTGNAANNFQILQPSTSTPIYNTRIYVPNGTTLPKPRGG